MVFLVEWSRIFVTFPRHGLRGAATGPNVAHLDVETPTIRLSLGPCGKNQLGSNPRMGIVSTRSHDAQD